MNGGNLGSTADALERIAGAVERIQAAGGLKGMSSANRAVQQTMPQASPAPAIDPMADINNTGTIPTRGGNGGAGLFAGAKSAL